MTGKFLILGANGQLGKAFAAVYGDEALALSRDQLDLNNPEFLAALSTLVAGKNIACIINCAAYTEVDKSEAEGKEVAFRVNGAAVGELAAWCKEHKLPLIHFSTDYVFDGSGEKPRNERAKTGPVSAYGESKLEGERALMENKGKYLIFRTSWVYDAYGKNFFSTMLRLFREKEALGVVADQIGAPTYAPHLARTVSEVIGRVLTVKKFPSGLYHLCSAGETSWHGFAQAIFALARTHDSGEIQCQRINPISSSDYPLPAKRPLNSRLDCSKAEAILGAHLPHWKEGLKECVEEKYGRKERQDRGTKDHPAGHKAG
jgi:dTDP-4-dehydrorhamnose reductase